MKWGRNKSIYSIQYSEGGKEPAKEIIWLGGQNT